MKGLHFISYRIIFVTSNSLQNYSSSKRTSHWLTIVKYFRWNINY